MLTTDESDEPVSPPASNLTTPDPVEAERRACEEFATRYSAPEYRGRFNRLYPLWWEINRIHFESRLAVPHISIGRTSPRRFCETRLTTDHGGQLNLVLADRVVFGTDRRVVRADGPAAPGLLRFIDDLLLAATVKQYVLEVLGSDEDGWGGYGPRFAAEATRIGATMGLPPVEPRRRGFRGAGQPVAAFWPWAFRPPGYYLGHVSLDRLRVAGLRSRPRPLRTDVVPGVYEYLLYLLVTGQEARMREILGREVDAGREARSPALAAAERSPADPSGYPLPVPALDPDWLTWNEGCVRLMAENVRDRRAFAGMPILADALEDAGCDDEVLLGHCRQHAEHTTNCWALRLLLAEPGSV